MALISTYVWKRYDAEAICVTQNTTAAGNLLINGFEADRRSGSPSGAWLSPRIWRTIAIYGDTDLSGFNFTITGTLAGNPQSTTLAGPTLGPVETDVLFDSVTSVTVDGAVTGVSIGTGRTGQTAWFQYNSFPAFSGLGVQVDLRSDAVTPIKYTFAHTLADAVTSPVIVSSDVGFYTAGIVVPNPDNANAFTLVMNEATARLYAAFMTPTRYCAIMFKEEDDEGCRAIVNFVQQGLT